jgi:hypothetical protein
MKFNKMKNVFPLAILLLVLFTGCESYLDLQPYDALTADQLLLDAEGIEGLTNGTLFLMKDPPSPDEPTPYYVRALFETTEFPSDNVLIVKSTTDPLWMSFTRKHTQTQANIRDFWSIGYKIILNSNTIINNVEIDESIDPEIKHLVGENYFYRAITFFDLARIFCFPPSHGRDKMGLNLRTGLGEEDIKARSTVGQTYDQIVSDLKMAVDLMTIRSSDGIKYGNKYAALGYLTRAYLFTEDYDLCIQAADQLLDGNSPFELDTRDNYVYGLQNSASSKESMFILYYADAENRGTASIGSMFNGDKGWGEVYPSAPYNDIINKYPHDVRNDLLDTIYSSPGVPELYPGSDFVKIYVTKFSYQNGIPTVHSPIFMRLSEVLLNRAEAYAHLGNDQLALDDVNAIRMRAGLSGEELITLDNLASHDYSTVLDAVLGEKRLELAFEGYRRDELLRNKIDLDRSFSSAQNFPGDPDIYPYNGPRQIYYIPLAAEINYNPLCIQND